LAKDEITPPRAVRASAVDFEEACGHGCAWASALLTCGSVGSVASSWAILQVTDLIRLERAV